MAFDDLIEQISLQPSRTLTSTPRYGEEVRRYDAFRDMFKLADAIVKYQKSAETPIPRGTSTLAAQGQEFNNLLNLLGTTGRVTTKRQSELFNLPVGWTIPTPSIGGGGGDSSSDELSDLPPELASQVIAQLGSNPTNEQIDSVINTLRLYSAMNPSWSTGIERTISYLNSLKTSNSGGGNKSPKGTNIWKTLGDSITEANKNFARTAGAATATGAALFTKLKDNPVVEYWGDQINFLKKLITGK
jgi:hypothetical protein